MPTPDLEPFVGEGIICLCRRISEGRVAFADECNRVYMHNEKEVEGSGFRIQGSGFRI